MKHYLSVNDIDSVNEWVEDALILKKKPLAYKKLGKQKTIGLLFFNNSLRTRLSTQKAAMNLGMKFMTMNFGKDGWALEFEDGTIMDKGSAEHIKEAAQVVSQYCDILGIRAFASLENQEEDESEMIINSFRKYASIPVLNMESSLSHPLQALADILTIEEYKKKTNPKIVLSWAPHPRALPHAVANSFVKAMQLKHADFVITHPEGYELDPKITNGSQIEYDQEKALKNADFVYVKNWSNYKDYGRVINQDKNWMMTQKKLGDAKFMHCLPVRRNIVVEDAVLDGNQSLVIAQANNRTFAAQIVLKKMLESLL
ncbi:MAG: acetylornithine carbamoyltransferase [Eudoraea sp.]|nr:acetylornithine carbamoyltransferase [Eudoraea sp.]MBT8292744.1 acetylornithine carbamoyltransferase [Eudoraea sp.]NNL03309.1 acetylornithine carbamoyltransferase [Eudoraea sp.]